MYKNKRQKEIAEYVYEHTEATVTELSKLFNVSQVTIRKDLAELADRGVVFKTHGGATQTEHLMVNEVPYYRKYTSAISQKKRIGKVAATLIEEKKIIIIDNGSTTNEIVSYMVDQENVVITNDARIAYRLALFSNMNIVISGGYLKKGGFSIFGSVSEQMFSQTLADICFLSLDSIDVDYGISYNYLESVSIKEHMLKNSNKVVAVCDSSKIGKKSFAKLCDVSEIDILITDQMDKETKDKFEKLGVQVILA